MKTWVKILISVVVAAGLITLGYYILRFIHWVHVNHPEWFIYFISFIVFCFITVMVYYFIDVIILNNDDEGGDGKSNHIRPNLW
jgi:hypothetical protein